MRYIVMAGNPVDGLRFFGPFDDSEEANEFADDACSGGDWWTVPLSAVKPEDQREDEARIGKFGVLNNLIVSAVVACHKDDMPSAKESMEGAIVILSELRTIIDKELA